MKKQPHINNKAKILRPSRHCKRRHTHAHTPSDGFQDGAEGGHDAHGGGHAKQYHPHDILHVQPEKKRRRGGRYREAQTEHLKLTQLMTFQNPPGCLRCHGRYTKLLRIYIIMMDHTVLRSIVIVS